MLNQEDFLHVVKHAPLFAIDLVVLNDQNQILLGERKNAPAKGFWFVPGGRVFKNESLEQAFERISHAELGLKLRRKHAKLLGLYDHFYEDSVFGPEISTHYINATHFIRLDEAMFGELLQSLPQEQHHAYQWMDWQALNADARVHAYSKVFLTNLGNELNS